MAHGTFFDRSIALNDPHPFKACFWGVTEHPRYHDCANCDMTKHCDYGAIYLGEQKVKEYRSLVAKCDELLAKASPPVHQLP